MVPYEPTCVALFRFAPRIELRIPDFAMVAHLWHCIQRCIIRRDLHHSDLHRGRGARGVARTGQQRGLQVQVQVHASK